MRADISLEPTATNLEHVDQLRHVTSSKAPETKFLQCEGFPENYVFHGVWNLWALVPWRTGCTPCWLRRLVSCRWRHYFLWRWRIWKECSRCVDLKSFPSVDSLSYLEPSGEKERAAMGLFVLSLCKTVLEIKLMRRTSPSPLAARHSTPLGETATLSMSLLPK